MFDLLQSISEFARKISKHEDRFYAAIQSAEKELAGDFVLFFFELNQSALVDPRSDFFAGEQWRWAVHEPGANLVAFWRGTRIDFSPQARANLLLNAG